MALDKFAIGFDHRDRARLHALWDAILDDEVWSDGPLVKAFEDGVGEPGTASPAVATSSWTGAALAALEFFELRGKTVLCPSNTFMASPLAADRRRREGRVRRLQPRRPLHVVRGLRAQGRAARPAAVMLVHIGGHIAFDIERIAELCRAEGIVLLEDCAHAHGASWNGRRPGTYGDAGIWSFAPTKTISTGEGGMLVSRHDELIEFARAFRNYGKPDYASRGLNFRMNEFTAALGIVATERLDEIVAWKNRVARNELDPRIRPGSSCPTGWSPASTSTSSSSRSSARPARSTTCRATVSSGTQSTSRTPTGSRRTTGARRSTTGPQHCPRSTR